MQTEMSLEEIEAILSRLSLPEREIPAPTYGLAWRRAVRQRSAAMRRDNVPLPFDGCEIVAPVRNGAQLIFVVAPAMDAPEDSAHRAVNMLANIGIIGDLEKGEPTLLQNGRSYRVAITHARLLPGLRRWFALSIGDYIQEDVSYILDMFAPQEDAGEIHRAEPDGPVSTLTINLN